MKKLAEYLADYIEYEKEIGKYRKSNLCEIISQGIEAFESTENCKLTVEIK